MTNRHLLAYLIFLICFCAVAQNSNNQLDNRIRVKFTQNFDTNAPQFDSRNGKGFLVLGDEKVDALNEKFQATGMQRVFPYAGKFEEKHERYGLHLWYDIVIDTNTNIEDLVARYGELDVISEVEPIQVYNHDGLNLEEVSSNDPLLIEQWHYDNRGKTGGTVGADISLLDAWEVETGDPRVIVSVHDSGIDTNHPDLVNRLWTNEGEVPNDGIDNDNNGFVDDYYGYNFAAAVVGGNPSSVYDYNGHGTHTSGTIAAENNNGIGVAGVAGGTEQNDGVRIMMMRLGNDNGSNAIYNPAPSFVYAADMGAVISSNSWGGGSYDQSVVDAINYFIAEGGSTSPALDGGLVIMSSGNSSSSYPDYRSDIDGVMMVSATNDRDRIAWYSNYGQWVDISAPGGETSPSYRGVLSTLPNNGYGFYQGTSMACPHVSGAAALLASKAYGSRLTRQELFDAIIGGVNSIDNVNPSYVGLLGSGRLNVTQSLELVGFGSGGVEGELLIDPVTIYTEIQKGDSETHTIRLSNTSSFDLEVDIESENQDWIGFDVVNLSIAANSVAKFDITLNTSNGGDVTKGEIVFSFIGLNNLEKRVLPISVYTLGDPELTVQDTLTFATNYLGMSEVSQLLVSNSGTDYLEITAVSNSNENYHIEFDNTVLSPDKKALFEVTFTPSVEGAVLDSLYFISNDPTNDSIKVILTGTGNSNIPPTLELDRLEIVSEIENSNRYGTEQLTITNRGDDVLTFNVQVNPNRLLDLDDFEQKSIAQEKQDGRFENETERVLESFGDLSTAVKSPVEKESGLAWDGEYLWIKNASSEQIYQFDPETETVIDSITSIANSGVALTFDGTHLWEHDYQSRLIKYSLDGDSITQITLDPTRDYRNGIDVEGDGIWMSYSGYFVLIDSENGSDIESFSNGHYFGREGLISVGNRLFTINEGRLSETAKGSPYADRSTDYIAGFYREETADITYDGLYAWVSFNDHKVLLKIDLFSDFLNNPYPSSYSLEGGESVQLALNYGLSTYYFDDGLVYSDEVHLVSNDPNQNDILVPFQVDIIGSPNIAVRANNLFIENYIGFASLDTITIENEGNEILSLSGITTTDTNFEFEFDPVDISPKSKYQLPISLELSSLDTLNATFTIVSNDPDNPSLNIDVQAISYLPPVIEVVEDSMNISLYQSELDSLAITITNSGEGNLRYYVENNYGLDVTGQVADRSDDYVSDNIIESKEQDEDGHKGVSYSFSPVTEDVMVMSEQSLQLEEVLEALNQDYALLTSLVPNRYDFSDGDSGYGIYDGGNNMYDYGNRLSTNLGGELYYTNGAVHSNSYLGGREYFTSKYRGLFVFAANMENVHNFYIRGGLGADGGGGADGTVLSVTKGGTEFLGFVKRVYGTSHEPSVNHLIIVPDNGRSFHEFDTYTNYDTHTVNDLSGTNRLYYLLFASAEGGYIDDSNMFEIMNEFLGIVGEGGETVSVEPGNTVEDYVVFDASELDTGRYQYNIEIFSNDPENPIIEIPTTVTVNSAPVFKLDKDTAMFGGEFVGGRGYENVYISNAGNDTLIISQFSINSEYFDFELDKDTIPPAQYSYGSLTFDPKDTVDYTATLNLTSNDPVRPVAQLAVKGTGISSTILSTSTYSIRDTVSIGPVVTYPFTVESSGTDSLDYRIVIQEKASYNQLVQRIEEINASGQSSIDESNTSKGSSADYSISSTGNNRILLLGAADINSINAVNIELFNLGQFAFVSHINVAEFSSITLNDLEPYDAVLVWKHKHYSYQDATTLGNVLADYVDAGGGVVTAMYENTSSSLGGRWSSNHEKYSVQKEKNVGHHNASFSPFMEKLNPGHELLQNVDNLNSRYGANLPNLTSDDLQNGVEIVAQWNDGTPVIVTKETESAQRVDLGFYPLSNNYEYRSWLSHTDGNQILVNALNYVANKTEGRSDVDWVTVSDYEVNNLSAGDSVVTEFVVDTEKLEEGWSGARAFFYSNDSRNYVPSIYLDILAIGESNLSIPDSVHFGQVSLGLTGSKGLTVLNSGDGSAKVLITIDSLSNFKVQHPDTTFVRPFDRKVFNITYTPDSIGTHSAVATLYNISAGTTKEIVLTADVVPPGIIRLEPAEISLMVEYQGEVESEFRIHNDGEGDLEFFLESFHLSDKVLRQNANGVEHIEFSREPIKGEVDFRKGHSISNGTGTDNFGYIYVDSNEEEGPMYRWNDISASGSELTLEDDDAESVKLPFEFPLYGFRYSELFIGSNGLVGTNLAGATSPINQQIPFGSAPNGFIAPFWKDLVPGQNGKVFYEISEEHITIQYQDFEDYERTGVYTFQVVLYKSGDVLMQYEEMKGTVTDATIGLENHSGGIGLQIAFNTPYIHDKLAVYVAAPVSQINPDITSGFIKPGDSLAVPFTYSALDDLGGIYEREIAILSNDTSSLVTFANILVNVEGTARMKPFIDSLYFDSTYVSRVTKRNTWFKSDSVGVLEILEVHSTNDDFAMLQPEYEAVYDGEDSVFYDLVLNTSTGSIQGEISISDFNGHLVAVRGYVYENGTKKSLWEVDTDRVLGTAGNYSVSDLVDLSNESLWKLQKGEIYLDVFTTLNLDGLSEVKFDPLIQTIQPNEYSLAFPTLYKPSTEKGDTTLFSVESNAINTDEVAVIGFGVGLESDVAIEVSVKRLEGELSIGDSTTQVFTISNNGADSLRFALDMDDYRFESNLNPIGFDGYDQASTAIMKNSEFYGYASVYGGTTLVASQTSDPLAYENLHSAGQGYRVSALEFVPGSSTELIGIDRYGNLFKTDLSNDDFEYVAVLSGDDYWSGLTTDIRSRKLFASTRASLYEIDLTANSAIYIGNFNDYGILGIAMDSQGDLYGYTINNSFVKIDPTTGTTTYIGGIGFNADFDQDLAYNPETNEIYMAAYNRNSFRPELRKVDRTTGSSSLVGLFNPELIQFYSLAFRLYNNDFFTTDVSDSVLAPNQSLDIVGLFKADSLSNGRHSLTMRVLSNDQSNPSIEIPVSLAITGNTAEVGFFAQEINFGLHTIMDTVERVLVFENVGDEVLVLKLVNEMESNFKMEIGLEDSLRVDINETLEIPVQFIPTEAKTFEHDLIWNTNDPNSPKVIVSLSGAGERDSRELTLEMSNSHFELPRNASTTASISLHSVGKDSVFYTLSPEEEFDWMSGSSDTAYIASGDSVEYLLTLNTEGTDLGEYASHLILTSDDPLYDSLSLPITLSVYNQLPEVLMPMENALFAVGMNGNVEEYRMSDHFQDADGDSLYYVVSSRNAKVNFSLADDVLSMFGTESGFDTLDIVAHDNVDTIMATLSIVANFPPTAPPALPVFSTRIGESYVEYVDLDDYFADPDGLELSFTISGLSENFADININSDNLLLIKGLDVFNEKVTITASDGYHSAEQEFTLIVDDVLGTGEIGSPIALYPNPVSSILTYEYNLNSKDQVTVQFVDISGKIVRSEKQEVLDGKIRGTIDVSKLATGIYMIKVLDGEVTVFANRVSKK